MRAQVRKLMFGLTSADFCKNCGEANKSGKMIAVLNSNLNQTLEGLQENKHSSAVIIVKADLLAEQDMQQ